MTETLEMTPTNPNIRTSRGIVGLLKSLVYPLTIACFGFVFYKVLKGDYPSLYAYAVLLNILMLGASAMFSGRSNRVLGVVVNALWLAAASWMLFLVSQRQILVLILLIPYLIITIQRLLVSLKRTTRPVLPA